MSDRITEIWSRIVGRVRVEDCGHEDGPCWVWIGPTSGNNGRGAGYPRMSLDGCTVAVHRIMWQLINGPIVGSKQIDHRCRTRLCVNPAHLKMVTHKQNQKLRDEAMRLTDKWLRSQEQSAEGSGMATEDDDERYDGLALNVAIVGLPAKPIPRDLHDLTTGSLGRDPDSRGPMTPEQVQQSWIPQWWGLMDCDRCSKRTGMPPCLECPRLKDKRQQLNQRRGYPND